MNTTNDADDPLIPADGHVEDAAYHEGRLHERRRIDHAGTVSANEAYVRGRRDERVRRRGSPLLTFILLIVVAIGAVLIYFAIQNGSFSGGGAVIDQKISSAAEKVQAPIRGAADKAGTALQNAGTDLKQDAGSGKP